MTNPYTFGYDSNGMIKQAFASESAPQDDTNWNSSYATVTIDDSSNPTGFTVFWNQDAYIVQNGQFVTNPNYGAIEMAQSQAQQTSAINAGYTSTIAAGFTSNATGSAIVYGCQADDILDLQVTQSAITQGVETFPIAYGALNGSIVSITSQTMLTQLETDMNTFAWAQKKQLRTLLGQVQAQTSVPTTLIAWTPGSYTPQPAP